MNDFTVFPAIDLRGGRCVRLKQGDFERSREYDADPVQRAREWERRGARTIHVVDLDGAKEGRPVQLELIHSMAAAVDIPLQVGGGIRTLEDLKAVRAAGAKWVVVGTAAVTDAGLRGRMIEATGPDLIVAVDARDGIVATHAWQRASGVDVLDFASDMADEGVASVLFTDVSRDGMDAGPSLEATAAVGTVILTIASGGIRDAADVAALTRLDGVIGAVVGTALYENRVTLEELLQATV